MPESFIQPRNRRRVTLDPDEPMYNGEETSPSYAGEAGIYPRGGMAVVLPAGDTAPARAAGISARPVSVVPPEGERPPARLAPPAPDPTERQFDIPPSIGPRPTVGREVEVPQPSQLEQWQQERDHLATTPAKDRNGRFKSMLINALVQMGQNAQAATEGALRTGRPVDAYGLAAVMGGAGGGLAAGALNPALDEERRRQYKLNQVESLIKTRLSEQRAQAGDDYRRAQTGWLQARPVSEGKKADAATRTKLQAAIQREISNRLKEPRPFDPSDAYDADLAERAEAADVRFSPGMFGDFKNPAQLEVIDPSDPSGTRKTRLVYDRETGAWRPLTVGGQGVTSDYTQPVDPKTGMTEFQKGSLLLGTRRADETEKQHGISNEFTRQQLGLARGRLSLAQAAQDYRFDEQSRKHFGEANKLAAQAEEYARVASSLDSHSEYTDPDTGERKTSTRRVIDRDKFFAKADAARRELLTTYRDAFTQNEQGHVLMTEAEFKALFPSLAAKSADTRLGEALRLGIELTDGPGAKPDSTNYTPSPIKPRARRSPAAGADRPATQSKGRVARSNFDKVRAQNPSLQGKSDAEVEAALRAQGVEVY